MQGIFHKSRARRTFVHRRRRCYLLRLELAKLRRISSRLRTEKMLQKRQRYSICVASPLTKLSFISRALPSYEATFDDQICWASWCPCCKRPLELRMRAAPPARDIGMTTAVATLSVSCPWRDQSLLQPPRYAFCSAIWGGGPGFALGALVLGEALRRTSAASHDRVLLHTDDVPDGSLQLLATVWLLRRVDYIDAANSLFISKNSRFDGCFTKLHVLGLTEYAKVLMLDLDLAILGCPDVIFELPTPAALCRGVNCKAHGDCIDGRNFFRGEDDEAGWEWGQGGGINAGVMLLEPNETMYRQALQEIAAPLHPEHMPGAGPEQDYLSRFYAPWWTNISVIYNFQLHHVFFNLEACLQWRSETCNEHWLPERLSVPVSDIQICHFSGELKMWDREFYFRDSSDAEFAERLIRNCDPRCYRLWVERLGSGDEYNEFGVQLADRQDCGQQAFASKPVPAEPLVEHAVAHLRSVVTLAAACWRRDFHALHESFPELPSSSELLCMLGQQCPPTASSFAPRERVEVWWASERCWHSGTVQAVNDDLTLDVVFDNPEWWHTPAKGMDAEYVRKSLDNPDAHTFIT